MNTSSLGQKASYVIPRYFYQFIGVDGLPKYIQPSVIEIKAGIFENILTPLGIDPEADKFLQPGSTDSELFNYQALPLLSEDTAWFGPLAFPLITLAVIFAFFSRKKPLRRYALFSSLFGVLYVVLIMMQRPGWDPYQGRYFILGLAPMLPLTGFLLPNQKFLKYFPLLIIVPICLFLSFNTLCTNVYKPIIDANKVYAYQNEQILTLPENTKPQIILKNYLIRISNRIGDAGLAQRSILTYEYYDQLFMGYREAGNNLAFIEQYISEDTPLYITIQKSVIEYGLFGKNKTRNLYPVKDVTEVPSGYYLVSSEKPLEITSRIKLIAENKDYILYSVSP